MNVLVVRGVVEATVVGDEVFAGGSIFAREIGVVLLSHTVLLIL